MAKKPSVKTLLIYESFQLDAAIANGCDIKGNFGDIGTCGYYDDNGMAGFPTIVFITKPICETRRPGGGWTDYVDGEEVHICATTLTSHSLILFNS